MQLPNKSMKQGNKEAVGMEVGGRRVRQNLKKGG